jgi:hypothetical protein
MEPINQNFSSFEPSLGIRFQALGIEAFIKQVEVWSSNRMNEKINQLFSSFEQSLGLRFQALSNETFINQLEVWSSITMNGNNKSKFQLIWAKPCPQISSSRDRDLYKTAWGLKFNHKEWKETSKFQLMLAKPWAHISSSWHQDLHRTAWGLKFNHKEWKKLIKISAHKSQALGSDFKLSEARPS